MHLLHTQCMQERNLTGYTRLAASVETTIGAREDRGFPRRFSDASMDTVGDKADRGIVGGQEAVGANGQVAQPTVTVPQRVDMAPTAATDTALGEIVHRLVVELHPRRLYLFGSRARGDARGDSDYDVLVLVDDTNDRSYRLEQQAYGALAGFNVPVDVLVMTVDHFNRRQIVKASLPATVGREGRLLYVA